MPRYLRQVHSLFIVLTQKILFWYENFNSSYYANSSTLQHFECSAGTENSRF